MSKVVFLDIDGPMIPVKAYMLPGQTTSATIFDPCATSLLLRILEASGAKIVISSTHGKRGKEHIGRVFAQNGIDLSHLHNDWVTPRKMSSARIHEIQWWLDAHPEVTHYVAIDDEQLDINWIPNSVQCDAYEGFSFRNYLECLLFLDTVTGKQQAEYINTVQYLKRREIWRTKRCEEEGHWYLHKVAAEIFPLQTDQPVSRRLPPDEESNQDVS